MASTIILPGDNGQLLFRTQEQVDDLLAANADMRNAWRPGQMVGDTQRHFQTIASLPTHLYLELEAKFGPIKENRQDWLRWLNDPDNRGFLTTGGTV